jgi:hypothetical protein
MSRLTLRLLGGFEFETAPGVPLPLPVTRPGAP